MKDSRKSDRFDGSEIAIIAMAGRFPGASNLDAFWDNLQNGTESVTFFSDEQLLASGVDPEVLNDKQYVKARSVLKDVEMFDPAFFGFSPREAECMDPQHRLLLECVWEAVETAGYDPERFKGAISLFAGASMNSYLLNNLYANPEAMALAGDFQIAIFNNPGALATGIAYKLNFKGPCFTVLTLCSTSLVAVHIGCQSLLNFECDMALAGGASIFIPQNAGYWYQEGLIVSPTGHCRPFDAKAQGTVFGNGLGVVVLKRLEDALADGDNIEAVIIGSALNNDGSVKVSYTAPSTAGQAEVIVEALANAEIEPETITYVETHGTGTALGDPVEVAALTQAFRTGTQKKGYCALGSVKSNIGHLDAASGVASLIKTVLALKHKEIPPSLHFESPNPDIDFKNSPFFVNTQLSAWETGGIPRRAGVSSFGVGGTNAHVIVQEAPDLESSSTSRPYQLLILSARTNSALNAMTTNFVEYLKEHPDLNLADVAHTLQVGRRDFGHRRMFVCQNSAEAVSMWKTGDSKSAMTVYQKRRNPPVAFMFSGQGSQYVDMGLELYESESEFKKYFDRCSEIIRLYLGIDLRDIIYPAKEKSDEAIQKLSNTLFTQPALFTIEYALARLWISWGVQPAALVGHSIGEYVAACLAGVFSLEDALSLVATRGKLMQELPSGSMLAVILSEKELEPYLGEELSLAAVNGPSFCVVSGDKEAIKDLETVLAERRRDFRHLHTSHGFHSKMMNPILNAFREKAMQVHFSAPQIPIASTVTGTWVAKEEIMDPKHWTNNLRQTVRFNDAVKELLKEDSRVFLEVGPGKTLSTLVKQHSNRSKEQIVLSSLRHPQEQKSDYAVILDTLGKLWLAGIEVDWSEFYRHEKRRRIPLPTYPFERQPCWIPAKEQPRGFLASRVGLSHRGVNIADSLNRTRLDHEFAAPRDLKVENDGRAPRNKVEKSIAEIWKKILGVKDIGIHDDYFDLGGNSVNAARLFAAIEKIFNKKIPLAALINAPTVEQLASILSEGEGPISWSSLAPIQTGGSKPPFFCIHAAGGNVLLYRDLARYLGDNQPVYGLQSQGLNGELPFLTRIEDMASHYLKEIQAVQPEGPYLLGGYCLGGTIAFEIAQQLHLVGQKVSLLALFETYNWANIQTTSFLNKVYSQMQRIEFHWRNFLLLDNEGKLAFINEKWEVARSRKNVWVGMIAAKVGKKSHSGNGQNLLLYNLWDVNDRAAVSYLPKVYPGKITHFRPIKEYERYADSRAGWDRLAAEGVETYRLPVYPAGMLVEPFVQILAEKLKISIDNAL